MTTGDNLTACPDEPIAAAWSAPPKTTDTGIRARAARTCARDATDDLALLHQRAMPFPPPPPDPEEIK